MAVAAAPDLDARITEAAARVGAYAQAVLDGTVVAGELVRLACQRHLDDLARDDLAWDPVRAGRGILWFPTLLRHYKGRWGAQPGIRSEGLPFELDDWEAFIVGSAFGWTRRHDDGDVVRRYRTVYIEVGKKNGKTSLAAGLGIQLAFFDDEPGAQVYAAATKRDQAKLVWRDGKEMVIRSPALARRLKTGALSISLPSAASFFQPLSSEEGHEEGIDPHAVIVDELHRLADRGLVDMLSQSFGARRQPMLLFITTAGDSTDETVWADEHSYAEQVVRGTLVDDTYFAYIATLDKADDPFNEAVWIKANPGIGTSPSWDDMRTEAAKAKASPARRPAFFRLRLNRRGSLESRFMPMEAWGACADDPVVPDDADAWGGLDLGWSDDLSALCLLVPNEQGYMSWVAHFWCPVFGAYYRTPARRMMYEQWAERGYLTLTDGDVRDDDQVEEGIMAAVEGLTIRRLRYDHAMASALVPRLAAKGLPVEPMRQGLVSMSGPTKELERLVLGHKIRHGGHPVLTWMAANLDVKADDNGNIRPTKPHKASAAKVDGMTAGIAALAGWLDDQAEVPDEPSVWDQDDGHSLVL